MVNDIARDISTLNKNFIIYPYKNLDALIDIIGVLVDNNIDPVICYKNENYLKNVEIELLDIYGSSILEARRVKFVEFKGEDDKNSMNIVSEDRFSDSESLLKNLFNK